MSTFVQILISGVALGCLYALVSLSFVVLLKATGHFNLLPGSFVLQRIGVTVEEDGGLFRSFINMCVWGAISLGISLYFLG